MQPWKRTDPPSVAPLGQGGQFYVNEANGEVYSASYVPSGPLASINPTTIATASVSHLPLPSGWERAVDETGRIYFIDHINKTTSWEDPRKRMAQLAQSQMPPAAYAPSPMPGYAPVGYPAGGLMTGFPGPTRSYQGPSTHSVSPGLAQASLLGASMQTSGAFQTSRMGPSTNLMTGTVYGGTSLALKVHMFQLQNGDRCTKCDTQFGLFTRTHHCRCCSREFCDGCTSQKCDIKSLKLTDARTCDFCFGHVSKGDEACLNRLIPYLTEPNEDFKSQAINEIASLLLVRTYSHVRTFSHVEARNMEAVIDLKLIDTLWAVLGDQYSHDTTIENRSRCFGLLSLIASKTISLSLSQDRVALLARALGGSNFQTVGHGNESHSGVSVEATKCIAFLAMQGQNKPLLMADPNIIGTLLKILATSTQESELQWAAMAIYYLASASLDDVVPQGLGEMHNVYPLVRLLSSQSEKLLQFATGTLEIIAVEKSNKTEIYENGGVEALTHLLGHPDKAVKTNAIAILKSLTVHDGSRKAMIQLHATKYLIDLIENADDPALQESGLSLILKLTQDSNYLGLMDDLVLLLPFISTQLTNMGTIQNQLFELLGIIIMDPNARARAGSSGVIHSISSLLASPELRGPSQKFRNILALLPTLAANTETNLKIIIECGAMTSVIELLGHQDQDLVFEASKILAALSSDSAFEKYITLEISGLLQGIAIEQLYSQHLGIQENILHIFANLATDQQCRIQLFSELPRIAKLLSSTHPPIQIHVAQIINCLAQAQGQNDALGKVPNLFSDLIHLLSSPNPLVREHACLAILSACCHSPENREVMYNTTGGIQTLVRLMAIPDEQVKTSASHIVSLYSMDPKFRKGIRDAGCFSVLIDNLLSNCQAVEQHSALALSNIVSTEQDAELVLQLGGIQSVVRLLSSQSPEVVSSAATAVSSLSHSETCRRALIEAGVVPKLCFLMAQPDPSLQFQSLNALSVLSTDKRVIQSITDNNGLQNLGVLLGSPNAEIVGHAVQVIMNMCRDNPPVWAAFISTTGAKPLVILSESINLEAQRLAVHTLAELSVALPNHPLIYEADGVAALLRLLIPTENKPQGSFVQVEAIMVLANLSHDAKVIQEILKLNGIQHIVPFLTHEFGPSSLFSAARIICNLTQLDNENVPLMKTQLSEASAVPKLHAILMDPKTQDNDVKQNVLEALAILASDPAEVASIVSRDAVMSFMSLLSNQPNETIKKNAAHLLGCLSAHEQCRKVMLTKECLTVLFTVTLEVQSRYSVLEIIQTLSRRDDTIADEIESEQLGFLLHIIIEDLSGETHEHFPLLLDILARLASSSQVRNMLLQFDDLFPMLLQLMSRDNTGDHVQGLILRILSRLSLEAAGKTRFRNDGILEVLLTRLMGKQQPPVQPQGDGPLILDLLGSPVQPRARALSQSKNNKEDSIALRAEIVAVLVTLSLSEENRVTMRKSTLVPFMMQTIASPNLNVPGSDLFLLKCLELIENMLYDLPSRELLENQNLTTALIRLASSIPEDAQTIQQILTVINHVIHYKPQQLSPEEISVLAAKLASSQDDCTVTMALNIFRSLAHFDAIRSAISHSMDKAVLVSLTQSTNAIIRKQAIELKALVG